MFIEFLSKIIVTVNWDEINDYSIVLSRIYFNADIMKYVYYTNKIITAVFGKTAKL